MRQIGQLFDCTRKFTAHILHRQKWRHGRISVSRISHMHITHSMPLSSSCSPLVFAFVVAVPRELMSIVIDVDELELSVDVFAETECSGD
jgi:hypothetical protein